MAPSSRRGIGTGAGGAVREGAETVVVVVVVVEVGAFLGRLEKAAAVTAAPASAPMAAETARVNLDMVVEYGERRLCQTAGLAAGGMARRSSSHPRSPMCMVCCRLQNQNIKTAQ